MARNLLENKLDVSFLKHINYLYGSIEPFDPSFNLFAAIPYNIEFLNILWFSEYVSLNGKNYRVFPPIKQSTFMCHAVLKFKYKLSIEIRRLSSTKQIMTKKKRS